MNVEIINVGTELLLGEVINTNATQVQKMCKDLGFNVYHQTVVGDNSERFLECLKIAFDRGANCVITTGGLGPTTDDLTKELSAKFLGLEMIYNQTEEQKVDKKCKYITGNDDVPQNNFKQAYFPQDAYILENNMGTANGCVMKKDQKMIINLPGPPKEISYVMKYSLYPYLKKMKKDRIYTFEYMTMFIGESKLEEVLSDLIFKQHEVSIALYAGEETVRIRLAVRSLSQEDADKKMEVIKQEIFKRIKEYIIVENDLKQVLLNNMVPLSLKYLSDFKLSDDFLIPYISQNPLINIVIDKREDELGEVIIFWLNDYSFEVPTFVKAQYSYNKIEARFIAQLYKYIKTMK